jgi:uncharacterized surface protein with fasciclin (FAS1) repeats
MKNLKTILGITFLALFVSSCNNDDNESKKTITEIAQGSANLSILFDALIKTGLADTFNTSGSYTLFAPSNASFEDFLNANDFATLDNVPLDILKEVLKNHVLTGTFYSSDISTGYVSTLAKGSASDNTISMYINVTDAGVIINGGNTNGGGTVTAYDIKASNGVIHVVDGVLGLPTIVNHAIANPNLSTLTSLLVAQGLVSTLESAEPADGAPFTVFAPLNSAFDTATLNLYTGLSSENKTAVLLYHVVGGLNVLSTAIPSGNIPTVQGQTFTITGTVIDDASTVNKNIVLTDVQCSNGIVHAIDKVLLPNLN